MGAEAIGSASGEEASGGSVLSEVFGLDGFEVLAAADAAGELEIMIETPAGPVGCPGCGAVATPKDRRPTWVADLPIAGRPVVLCWVKRGVDEHVWQRGTGGRPTAFATGIVDLTPGRPARLLDLVEGRSGAVLRCWLADRPEP